MARNELQADRVESAEVQWHKYSSEELQRRRRLFQDLKKVRMDCLCVSEGELDYEACKELVRLLDVFGFDFADSDGGAFPERG